MRDKRENPLQIVGKTVILDELQPKYFPYIIEWRNRPSINKWFNDHTLLTPESQKKWYENVYLPDETQIMFVRVDKKTLIPFAASGYVKIDVEKKRCIGARLMLGDAKYSCHFAFIESGFLLSDYIYQMVDVTYGHVMKNNRRALRYNLGLGSVINTGVIQYPEEVFVNGQELYELYCTKEMYLDVRKRIFEPLEEYLLD